MKDKPRFIFRTVILLITFSMAVYDISLLIELVRFEILSIKLYHLLWIFMLFGMIQVCVPVLNNHVSCGKMFSKHFKDTYNSSESLINHNITKNNQGALRVAFFWILLLSIIGIFYYKNIIDIMHIHLIVVFFYFSDQFCINFWCPFRAWIVRNKCCNSCRIYNWGYFMIFSPYIFIPSIWTYSLIFMSLLILIQWEYMHYKHPYRFLEITNANLQCLNCSELICKHKKIPSKSL